MDELRNGLGQFLHDELSLGGRAIKVFRQSLDSDVFAVAFEPGSRTYQVLANDQNRFAPPRSLPPLLSLESSEGLETEDGSAPIVVTRYAYSDGAFSLLEDLLAKGLVLSMDDFLEFARWLARALDYLHGHDIVHGQWNARSVVVIPIESSDGDRRHSLDPSRYRFELLNTGVCYRDAAAIPKEYIERGYFPAEVYLAADGVPDFGALDVASDVHCFASFLKDLMQLACSSEELPTQAARVLEELQREANRRSWKATPEELRAKELEILDHLYTIKVRSESFIQEGRRPREERCSARQMLAWIEDLHAKATSYREQLFDRGFAPVDVFGADLQHYTAFDLAIAPSRINSFEEGHIVLTGRGLPDELVRVTLDERHEGVQVISAKPDRLEFRIEGGFPSGTYKVSINNRRTNVELEVFSPVWKQLQPTEVHQPWAGFGEIQLTIVGNDLPPDARYTLWPAGETTPRPDGDEAEVEVVPVRLVREETLDAPESVPGLQVRPEQRVVLEVPRDTPPGSYALNCNFLETDLEVRIREELPVPELTQLTLSPAEVNSYRDATVSLTGRHFHPRMVVDLSNQGTELDLVIESRTNAIATVPAGFPEGEYELRLNREPTGATLRVAQPSWMTNGPLVVKMARDQQDPAAVSLRGHDLPPLEEGGSYQLLDRRRQPVADAVTAVEEVESGEHHRLQLAPAISRGITRIAFEGLDTGVDVRIRRPWPRSVWAAMTLLCLSALGFAGWSVNEHYRPAVDSITPAAVFNFGATQITLEGRHVERLELHSEDGTKVQSLTPERGASAGTYTCAVQDLAPGRYRLHAVGPLMATTASEAWLEVRDTGLRLAPIELHRFAAHTLTLSSATGFDVRALQKLALYRNDGSLAKELELADGRAKIQQLGFAPQDIGKLAVAVDGRRIGLDVQVLGPELSAIEPNPATRDARGRVTFALRGANLKPDLWVGVIPTEGETDTVAPLQRNEDASFIADLTPGSYRLVAGIDEGRAEPLGNTVLQVLPPPQISAVAPKKLDPGRKTSLTFEGVNLTGLPHIVLRPVDASQEPIKIPLDANTIEAAEGGMGRVREAIALKTGTYVVEPAAAGTKIEVYDDCQRLVDEFATKSDPKELLEGLRKERPTQDVLRAAADLFFDRGLFAEAREMYERLAEGGNDPRARFRASFLMSFLDKTAVPVVPADPKTAYGAATLALGWSGRKASVFEPKVDSGWGPLPWELEFVRAWTSTDVATRIRGAEASIAKKKARAGEFAVAAFEPADVMLADAWLDQAIAMLRKAQIAPARALLEQTLIRNEATWKRLTPADQALAHFWHGHTKLWFSGDEAAATSAFEQGAKVGKGDAARWCTDYLAALRRAPLDSEEQPLPGSGSWHATFLSVYRFYREIKENPNYNLLTEKYGSGINLTAQERRASERLHELLTELEAATPDEPFVHYALLYYLRNAQRISWPGQPGGDKAADHRASLTQLALGNRFENLRQFFLLQGELGPMDLPQFKVLPRDERKRILDRVQVVAQMNLPGGHRATSEVLQKRFLTPSTFWRSR